MDIICALVNKAQWGLVLTNQYNHVYPIAFSTLSILTATVQGANSNSIYSLHCLSDLDAYSITSFRDGVKSEDIYAYWIAIGG